MIYFTSDTHFNHDKDFIYMPRGFSSIKEADDTIINNWCSLVSNDDDIYVLGDFFLGTDFYYIDKVLHKLTGKIHLIIGNHDTDAKLKFYKKYSNIVEIYYATQITYKKQIFYLSHYPTITADTYSNKKHILYNLFGHTHSKNKFYSPDSHALNPYLYNVALDAHDNRIISIDTILTDIQNELKKL